MEETTFDFDFDQEGPMMGEVCFQGEQAITFRFGHFQRSFIHASSERKFKSETGETITTRTLGICGLLFVMRDGFWWEHVFN